MQKLSFKQVSFYLILVASPFVILLLGEAILRLSSFGNEYPLFIEVNPSQGESSPRYLQPNSKVINRYFAHEKLAPNVSPYTVLFKKEKNKDSFRIFIQGGSTAAGFPYGRWGSLQGMLEQRFKRLYPDKEIEIINTAMAAVNSYTLLDFVDEILAQQPDLILIYAGHNEYLGVMGVGSAFAAKGGSLAALLHLKFKNLRLYQLVQSLYYALVRSDMSASYSDKTLMSQVAKEKEIELNSPLYLQGITQFKENMSLILQKYQAAGVPVVIGNLVSNERGQLPFSSIGNVDWQAYKNRTAKASKVSVRKEVVLLNEKLSKEKTATSYYKLALNLEKLSQFPQAKEAFILAKDHDLLRFRAPSQFNKIIYDLTQKYQVSFLDNQAAFTANAQHGIIGNAQILEHLHPTVYGYFLLAESYAELINEQQLIGLAAVPYGKDKALLDIPISIIDKLYGDYVISKLVNDYPFTVAKQGAAKTMPLPASRQFEKQALIKRIEKADWLALQKELLVKYQQRNEIPEAAKIAGSISTAMVDNHRASYIAGQLYQQLDDWQLASFYHKKAVAVQADNVQYLLALAQDYCRLESYEKCLTILQQAKSFAADSSAYSTDSAKACARECQNIYSQCNSPCSGIMGASTRKQCLNNCNITLADCYSTCE